MALLGFDALGKLALGQLPNVFTNFFFSLWSQPQTKKPNVDSFTGFIFVPKTTPVVFSSFTQPSQAKVAYQNQTFVNFPLTSIVATPPSLVFTKFSEPIKVTVKDSGVSSSFFVQPVTPSVVVGGDFATFAVVKTKPVLQQGWSFVQAPIVQSYIFSKFEQPVSKPSLKEGFINTPALIPVQSYVFSRFEQPSAKRVLQLDQSFVNLPVTQVVFQPYVFGQFDQPQSRKPVQNQPVQFEVLPPTPVIVSPVFAGFTDFGTPQKASRVLLDFIENPAFLSPQNYVFTQFSQPQTTKSTNAQFTWFPGVVTSQPYVFSSFAQPSRVRYQTDSFGFVTQPTIIVIPPAFTGFSDFNLTQLIGSQRRQDGSSVQFTILPMPQVISVVNFTGFSDFNQLIQTQYNNQLDLPFEVIIPDDTFLPGGKVPKWKQSWGVSKAKKTQLKSSNIKEIIYDKDLNELSVRFQNDRVYNYTNVEDKRVKGLIRAKSSGKYLHNNLKGKYPTTRMK